MTLDKYVMSTITETHWCTYIHTQDIHQQQSRPYMQYVPISQINSVTYRQG